jgi:integrase
MFRVIMEQPTLTANQVQELVDRWVSDWKWQVDVARSQDRQMIGPEMFGLPGNLGFEALLDAFQPDFIEMFQRQALDDFRRNDLEHVRPDAEAMIQVTGHQPTEENIRIVASQMAKAAAQYLEEAKDEAKPSVLEDPPPEGPELPKEYWEIAAKILKKPLPPAAAAAGVVSAVPPAEIVPPPASPPLKLFSEAYSDHESDRCMARGDQVPWREQTVHQNRATVRLWIEFHGDRPLNTYTREDAEEFRIALDYLHPMHGRNPEWRLPMRAAIDRMKVLLKEHREASKDPTAVPEPPPKCLATKTIKRHMSCLSGFFSWLLQRRNDYKYRSENIFAGFKFNIPDSPRTMWTEEELQALFKTPVWTGSMPVHRVTPGPHRIYDAAYWLPLLAVFHGLRLEEIAQLSAEDVFINDHVWVIRVHPERRNKLKNDNANRVVPIHKKLIELGFLTYVELIRKRDNRHMWPKLKPGSVDAKLSSYYTKAFTNYCKAVGLYDPLRPFHALRATFRTFLEEQDIKSAHISKLLGHSLKTALGEGATYVKSMKSSLLKEVVDRFDPEIDLSHLESFDPNVHPVDASPGELRKPGRREVPSIAAEEPLEW